MTTWEPDCSPHAAITLDGCCYGHIKQLEHPTIEQAIFAGLVPDPFTRRPQNVLFRAGFTSLDPAALERLLPPDDRTVYEEAPSIPVWLRPSTVADLEGVAS